MIPAILGAGVLGGSILANYFDNQDKAKNTEEAYKSIQNSIDAANLANEQDIADYKALLEKNYGSNAASYDKALQDFLNSEVYQNKDFTYTGDISDYFDPAANQQVAAAMDAINASSATGHNRFSSDYVNSVAAKQRALSSEAWRDAYDRMMKDRNQQLTEWQQNSNNAWNNYNATTAKQQAAVDAYGNDRNSYIQGMGDVTTAGMNNRLGLLQSQTNATTGLTNAQNANQGTWSQILGPASQFMGAYFGSSK